jgi:hypothetical protein
MRRTAPAAHPQRRPTRAPLHSLPHPSATPRHRSGILKRTMSQLQEQTPASPPRRHTPQRSLSHLRRTSPRTETMKTPTFCAPPPQSVCRARHVLECCARDAQLSHRRPSHNSITFNVHARQNDNCAQLPEAPTVPPLLRGLCELLFRRFGIRNCSDLRPFPLISLNTT